MGNALLGAERRGRLTRAESLRFLELLRQLPIRVVASTPVEMFGAIMELAREQGLSTYDAAYLHLAVVTLDGALRQAAGRCKVALS
ncbi:MAG: type II toxin-antitoxin system VapC family toxin [Anaerolineae bacterium]